MKESKKIRQAFLDYFAEKGHLVVDSAPIVVKDDPTLMFTNAGMNQFKDNFLGLKKPAAPRIADTQKCLRVSGKHNDLEEVGHDTYHHTMFEMLGNWSFGDYYKKEAIDWAWDLLTNVYKIPKDRLYFTVFGGDEADDLTQDREAFDEWKKYISEDRILPFGRKDNFWEMGDTGPCGPCSEIHVDIRDDAEREKTPGYTLVNNDHPEVIEIWNLVFMEFNRKADRSLEPLPNKSVDTGMGLERLCMVLAGVKANYDTDLFGPMKVILAKITGHNYEDNREVMVAFRVVMDHIRAISFAIADSQIPSNTGAGYVIRRILRRASRYAFQFLGQDEPFLFNLVPVLIEIYGSVFPELSAQRDFIMRIIEEEEKGFLKKLERGTSMFEEYLAEAQSGSNPDSDKGSSFKNKVVDGQFAFRLYDTFGFPIDLTQLMASEKGWSVDMPGFEKSLQEQKERGRKATEVKTGDWVLIAEEAGISRFVGYDHLEETVSIVQFRTLKTQKGNAYQVVLDKTPFYAESGGQVGDTGVITNGEETLRVLDTKKENDLTVHFTDKLPEKAMGDWIARVEGNRRRLIIANHSATHLLHAALRQVLGAHVEQRGSLVSEKMLRFDFSHFAKMTDEELRSVEKIVNARIASGISLTEKRNVPISEAKKLGAMALFGEKYGDEVRVIIFDPKYSVELCGGCHVHNTGEIRLFKIVSESSIAAGIRRIEAFTSDQAIEWLEEQVTVLGQVRDILNGANDLPKTLENLVDRNKELEKQLEKLNAEKVAGLSESLKTCVRETRGLNLLTEIVEVGSAEDLKNLSFKLKNSLTNALIVLGAVISEKPLLSVILSDDLAASGKYDAGKIIREIAREIQGGGGGQAFYASAGGKNAKGISAALEKVESLI